MSRHCETKRAMSSESNECTKKCQLGEIGKAWTMGFRGRQDFIPYCCHGCCFMGCLNYRYNTIRPAASELSFARCRTTALRPKSTDVRFSSWNPDESLFCGTKVPVRLLTLSVRRNSAATLYCLMSPVPIGSLDQTLFSQDDHKEA